MPKDDPLLLRIWQRRGTSKRRKLTEVGTRYGASIDNVVKDEHAVGSEGTGLGSG